MKNIFLILYITFGILFCYGNITQNTILSTIGIYGIIPSILAYYLLVSKKKNPIYLVAITSVYIGDITFNKKGVSIDLISLSGFITYNLLIMIIVFEKMKEVKFRKILIISPILLTLLLYTSYLIIGYIDQKFIAISIYFFSLSLLWSFCFLYYLKTKSKEALYFLIGVSSYVIASISKQFEYTENTTTLMILINISSYLFSQYFYCKAIVIADTKVSINESKQYNSQNF